VTSTRCGGSDSPCCRDVIKHVGFYGGRRHPHVLLYYLCRCWSVTAYSSGAFIAAELSRYNVDIAALSESRLADEGSLTEVGGGYTFSWKGLHSDDRRIHGVGFAIRTSLLSQITESPVGINAPLMTLRLPLIKGRYMTVVSAYAPTL